LFVCWFAGHRGPNQDQTAVHHQEFAPIYLAATDRAL
jgi:hypothetical protein